MNHNATAIIIGSGIAGLASAVRLATQGFQVHVYERNNYPGGKLSWFQQDGYAFDAGPSLFTQPQNIEELFQLAGEPIEKYFSYKKVPITCKYFYENGKTVEAFADKNAFAQEIHNQLGEAPKIIHQYLKSSEKLYNDIGAFFLNHSLHKRKTFCKAAILKSIAAIRYRYLFHSLHKYNSKKFRSAEAIQLFDRYATYNGSNPYKAPAMLSLIAHLEMNEGVFYPNGGMISITNALYELAKKKGVQFHFNTPVQRIIQHEGKAVGIVANNENHFAQVIVSNVDIYFTYKYLLCDEYKASKILKKERSSSAFIFYWGINKSFDELGLHNIFFSMDYKKEFECLFKTKTIYSDPTIYINITGKMESNNAPSGKENWFVMVNVPANTGKDWQALKPQIRKYIINKLNRILQTDMEPLIETESILDPAMIENKTASYMGSIYGTSSNARMAAFFRHPNFSKAIKELYFVGGTVHPGGGIPLCLKSAKIMSELVAESRKTEVGSEEF